MLCFNKTPKMKDEKDKKDETEISEWEKEFNKKSAHWGMIWWKEMEEEDT